MLLSAIVACGFALHVSAAWSASAVVRSFFSGAPLQGPPALRQKVIDLEKVKGEAVRRNLSVEALQARVKQNAETIAKSLATYSEALSTARDVNMTLEELGGEFARRSLSIKSVLQTYDEVEQTAATLRIPVEVFAQKVEAKASTIDKLVDEHRKQTGAEARSPGQGPREQPLLFIAIYTAFGSKAQQRRKEIRQTYLQHDLLQQGGPVMAKFVVGFGSDVAPQEESDLEQEVVHFPSQFLRLRVHERYEHLTYKTWSLLRWFAMTNPAKWLLKLDDDTFPHIDAIYAGLQQEHGRFVQMGMVFDCAPVLHTTKWAEDTNLWNYSFFPKYMQGSGYFLSAPLVQELADVHFTQNNKLMLRNEDAAIGVWIETQKRSNMQWPVQMKAIPSTLSGCSPGDWLSMNNLPGYMTCYWNRTRRGEKDICCYGPLGNLRQSLLQKSVRRSRSKNGCHQSAVDMR